MPQYIKDYYAVLKIPPFSNIKEVKEAYRKFAKQYHPDLGGSEDLMQAINEAYNVLKNPRSKKSYDEWYSFVYGSRTSTFYEEREQENNRAQSEFSGEAHANDYQKDTKDGGYASMEHPQKATKHTNQTVKKIKLPVKHARKIAAMVGTLALISIISFFLGVEYENNAEVTSIKNSNSLNKATVSTNAENPNEALETYTSALISTSDGTNNIEKKADWPFLTDTKLVRQATDSNHKVFVRPGPSKQSGDPILEIMPGDFSIVLKYLGSYERQIDEDGSHYWYKVSVPNGLIGWVRDDLVEVKTSAHDELTREREENKKEQQTLKNENRRLLAQIDSLNSLNSNSSPVSSSSKVNTCDEYGCSNPLDDPLSEYCSAHRCIVSGCHAGRMHSSTNYCIDHYFSH